MTTESANWLIERDLAPQLRDARGVAGLLGVRQLPQQREARRRVELDAAPRAACGSRRAVRPRAPLVGISASLVRVVVRDTNGPQRRDAAEPCRARTGRPGPFFFWRLRWAPKRRFCGAAAWAVPEYAP